MTLNQLDGKRHVSKFGVPAICDAFDIDHKVEPGSPGKGYALIVGDIIVRMLQRLEKWLNKASESDLLRPLPFTIPFDFQKELQLFKSSRSKVIMIMGYNLTLPKSGLESLFYSIPKHMWVLNTSDGCVSGTAYAEFNRHDEALASLGLSNSVHHGRAVLITPSSETELNETEHLRIDFPVFLY